MSKKQQINPTIFLAAFFFFFFFQWQSLRKKGGKYVAFVIDLFNKQTAKQTLFCFISFLEGRGKISTLQW